MLSKTTKQSSNGKLASSNLFLNHSDATSNVLYGLSQSRSFYTGSKMISATQNGNIIRTVEHKDYRTGKYSYRLTTNQGGLEALGVKPDFRAQSDFNYLLPKNRARLNETDLVRARNNQTILKAANGDKWTNNGSEVKELHPEIQYFRDEINVKHVSKSIMKGAYDGVKDGFKDAITLFKKSQTILKSSSKALGAAGFGLTAYTNYDEALKDGLRGKDAYVRTGVDTTVDTVVSGAVQGASTAFFTVAIPIPGVGTIIGALVGVGANYVLNHKGNNKKSILDRIKGWFH
ncbi:hypothetical protein [Paraliobacillus sp. JSM ZJ581]|uniref:hypothetical protein n=1 Tax=Paraliobacillus sp. JSM ZJ581 TaxID=3342118 RepID=UPI0035A8284B